MPADIEALSLAGPLFIGAILVWALFGSLTIQLYDYHNTSRSSDRVSIQILVYIVFLVELLQTVLITHTSWVTLIANWGDIAALISTPWSSATTPVLNGIVSASVQCFFAWRVWQLTHSNIGRAVAILIVAVASMQLGAAAAVTAEVLDLQTWLAGSLVCDSIIAISMVTILMQAQRQSRFKATETMLNRLIVNTIETGAITAGIALVELILFKLFPSTYYHITTEYVLGRMYSNVLFASLNGRQRSRNTIHGAMHNFGTVNGEHGTEMSTFGPAQSSSTTKVGSHPKGVVISTTVDTDMVKFITHFPEEVLLYE
ncbi:hypothetical protein FB451DRAFT_1404453 [Mycena latifolia]|nr:hypothetical protein FB451DRAFT_1404453 [Mycena latifolia]